MPEPAPIDLARSRFPRTPDEDRDELQDYAEHLDRLRRAVRGEKLRGVEIAVTFDPRGSGAGD